MTKKTPIIKTYRQVELNRPDCDATLDDIACIRWICHWFEIPEWFE